MIFRSRGPDGKVTMRRPKYELGAYAVPERTLTGLRAMSRQQTFAEATTAPDGMLRGYTEVSSFERGGHTWHAYQANGSEHCIEVEVVGDSIGKIDPVAPDRAWEIALARDREVRPGMIYD